jgi:hypothetical protein
MALEKQSLDLSFNQGLNTKSDPYRVPFGQFLSLENSVFGTEGRLTKRNGYGALGRILDATPTFLTTFNNNLTALGDRLLAYSEGSATWSDKGLLRSVDLSVLPLVRNSLSQTQADTAIATNGWICTAYTQVGDGDPSNAYTISDSITGQNIKGPVALTDGAGSAKVALLGNYFIIVYLANVASTPTLKFVAVNAKTGDEVLVDDVSTTIGPSSACPFDILVVNNALYIVWNGSDLGGAVRITKIDQALTVYADKDYPGYAGTSFSLAADTSSASAVIYASFFDLNTSTGTIFAVSPTLQEILAPTDLGATEDWASMSSLAADGVCTLFYEVINTYTFSDEPTNYIQKLTVSASGTVSVPTTVIRSVGLASKLFEMGGLKYFLSAYYSPYQPSFFLVDENGKVVAKLAYSNGGGYLDQYGLPSVNVSNNVIRIPYLRKNTLIAANASQNISDGVSTSKIGIYAQLGVNLATFTIGTSDLGAAEIGGNLNITGGFVWAYDGVTPVEQGFHLWPDSVFLSATTSGGGMSTQLYEYVATYEWADNQGNIFRSAPSIAQSVTPGSSAGYSSRSIFASGDTSLVVADSTGFFVGQAITDSTTGGNIAANTKIVSVDYDTDTIVIDKPTLGSSAIAPGDLLHVANTCSVSVEIPTLRLTYKIANPVRLVLYRWSTAQQTYYQVTSIVDPLLNDVTADSVTYVDTAPDSAIIGNNILYTTGGVVENIAAPACAAMTLYKSRLVVLDAEDRNNLWFSKQVIPGAPVEMSDLFTQYVSPTVSAQGSTGTVTTLGALDDKLILFKRSAIYYMVGTGPDNTGANNDFSDPVFVTATVGCNNQQSIVFIPSGLMFQSDKGIWLLGRDLSTKYIGAPVEQFTNEGVVQSAVNIPGNNQVRFTLDTGVTLMYDYYYNQWGTFTNVPAISSTLYNGLHTYLDNLGRVFQETPGRYLDRSSPVLMSFTTSWINLAGVQGFERAYEFYLLGTYISPHKLYMSLAYDYNPAPTQQIVITPDNPTNKWGGEALWGSGSVWGGEGGNIEQWRVFFKQQKCQSFQISMQEVFDASIGEMAGAGLTLSGLNIIVGTKKGRPSLRASRQVG